MDLAILAIGRLKGAEQELCDRYLTRIEGVGRKLGIRKSTLIEFGEARAGSANVRRGQEAGTLLKKTGDKAFIVALDERGKSLDSQKFSQFISGRLESGIGELAFVLGGPDGHGDELLSRANTKLSLSPMTMPHGLARAVLCEQLYRALTILDGHPYHRI